MPTYEERQRREAEEVLTLIKNNDPVCRNCQRRKSEHHDDGQCLYDTSSFVFGGDMIFWMHSGTPDRWIYLSHWTRFLLMFSGSAIDKLFKRTQASQEDLQCTADSLPRTPAKVHGWMQFNGEKPTDFLLTPRCADHE